LFYNLQTDLPDDEIKLPHTSDVWYRVKKIPKNLAKMVAGGSPTRSAYTPATVLIYTLCEHHRGPPPKPTSRAVGIKV
jgi:hypothetical protein